MGFNVIQVTGGPAASAGAPAAAAASSAGKTYTVKAGDTLGAIAKEHLGSAGACMKVFELNKDVLSCTNQPANAEVLLACDCVPGGSGDRSPPIR